jgi:hypothetical protein
VSALACPSCGSSAIDLDNRECLDCRIGLPTGAFDVRPRYRQGRSSMRAARASQTAALSDKRTESIVGREP